MNFELIFKSPVRIMHQLALNIGLVLEYPIYPFTSTIENLLGKMYIEGALMSKSLNIAFLNLLCTVWVKSLLKTCCGSV